MSNHNLNFSTVAKKLSSLGIALDTPGFYNSKEFIREEKKNPNLLDFYAVFVEGQKYSDAYIEKANELVPKVANFICDELERDGRKGACVDISGYIVKFLEELGIWSYCATGLTKIIFDSDTKLPTTFLWPYNLAGVVGHQWVVAPPYLVVDPTLKFQEYNSTQSDHIPRCILAKELKSVDFEFNDLVEPEVKFRFPKPWTRENLESLDPYPMTRLRSMKSCGKIKFENCEVQYGCVATRFMEEESILKCKDWGYKPNGKSPTQLFEELKESIN